VRFISIAIIFVMIMSLPAVGWGAEYMNRIVVKVNNNIITEYDLKEKLDTVVERFESQGKMIGDAELAEIRKKLLTNMVDELLLQQELDRFQIKASDADVQDELEHLQAEYNLDPEAFKARIEEEGMSYGEFKKRVKGNLEKQRLMGAMVQSKVVVTDTEVKEAYEKHKEEYSLGGGLHLAVIMLPADVSPEEVSKKMADGDLTFEEAAAKFSVGPGADSGGDIGEFAWKDLGEEWRAPLSDMVAGDVKGPVVIQEANTFIKLIEKNEGNYVPFEEVKDKIYINLLKTKREKTFDDYFDTLREKAVIQYMN